jgi:hypothetical protein
VTTGWFWVGVTGVVATDVVVWVCLGFAFGFAGCFISGTAATAWAAVIETEFVPLTLVAAAGGGTTVCEELFLVANPITRASANATTTSPMARNS